MALDLANYEKLARDAVKLFWGNRDSALARQAEAGKKDAGTRGAVTAGKNMDGFAALMLNVIRANGMTDASIMRKRKVLSLPGYYRPTKLWDLIVLHRGRLVAALELKSQVGPSFGNNFNNRTEEAIGTAEDFRTAFREGAFGDSPPPFLGWLILVEDTKKSRIPVKAVSEHFPIFPDFEKASYLDRYDVLCRRLVQEQLYSSATVLASPRTSKTTGAYSEFGKLTTLKTFVTTLAGHIAAEAARG